MNRWPVVRAATGGLRQRWVQTVVIFLVLLASTATAALGLTLIVNSRGPFDAEFAQQHGADTMVSINQAKTTPAQLAATKRLPEVTAAAGPIAETIVQGYFGPAKIALPPITVAGRASPGGPIDNLLPLIAGHWPTGPGQIVISDDAGIAPTLPVGALTVTSAPGHPKLTVVGFTDSITDASEAWVVPSQLAALTPAGRPVQTQMLYRFHNAATTAQLRADMKVVAARLPPGTITSVGTWVSAQTVNSLASAVIAPFVISFGIIGIVLSVLIVASVVSGAVLAGYRRIGILKSLGFTPAQVISAYVIQVVAPTVPACVLGVVAGNLLATPVLRRTSQVFSLDNQNVPLSADVLVPLTMLALVALAAVLPALRAGRLSAAKAIAIGQAPKEGRGQVAQRLFGRLRLPRPVTLGLAAPFTRPGRTLVALAVILFGATSVAFAVGLVSSLNRAALGQEKANVGQVQVTRANGTATTGLLTPGTPPAQKVAAELNALPGTLRYVGQGLPTIYVQSIRPAIFTLAFLGSVNWAGFDMISGHWYQRPGQIVVNSVFLNETGLSLGDTVPVTVGIGGPTYTLKIVGQAFDPQHGQPCVWASWQTLGGYGAGLRVEQDDVEVKPGTDVNAYVVAVNRALGNQYLAVGTHGGGFYRISTALIELLTVMMALVAGLGVLHALLLSTRDRVYDLGVSKAIGMTPRQTIVMVVCWIVIPALVAAVIAVPVGMALHSVTLHAMGNAAQTGIPASYENVYKPFEIVLLGLAGLVIAVVGALIPASWAARARTASALRAE